MIARKLVVTAALIVLLLILASCGGGATSTPTSVPPTEVPATEPATQEVAVPPTEAVVTTEEPAAEATAEATEAAVGTAETAGGVTLTVTQENTALRGGPGTNYEVIVRVTVNAMYPVVATFGEGRNQWYQITLEDGTSAWAWARVVTLNPADAVVPVAAEVPPPPSS